MMQLPLDIKQIYNAWTPFRLCTKYKHETKSTPIFHSYSTLHINADYKSKSCERLFVCRTARFDFLLKTERLNAQKVAQAVNPHNFC